MAPSATPEINQHNFPEQTDSPANKQQQQQKKPEQKTMEQKTSVQWRGWVFLKVPWRKGEGARS
jgi:hypothetical protein